MSAPQGLWRQGMYPRIKIHVRAFPSWPESMSFARSLVVTHATALQPRVQQRPTRDWNVWWVEVR